MERRISDYLHLYLGCNVVVENNIQGDMQTSDKRALAGPYKLIAVEIIGHTRHVRLDGYILKPSEIVKPLLRPLSDITEEEATESGWMGLFTLKNFAEHKRYRPDSFPFLLSKCFDLLELIEAGLAIDVTKM